jgi:hypothetical protein
MIITASIIKIDLTCKFIYLYNIEKMNSQTNKKLMASCI